MGSPVRLLLAVLLTAPLCACAAYKPPPPTGPHRIGWKHSDGRRAEGPIVQQAETICNRGHEVGKRRCDPFDATNHPEQQSAQLYGQARLSALNAVNCSNGNCHHIQLRPQSFECQIPTHTFSGALGGVASESRDHALPTSMVRSASTLLLFAGFRARHVCFRANRTLSRHRRIAESDPQDTCEALDCCCAK